MLIHKEQPTFLDISVFDGTITSRNDIVQMIDRRYLVFFLFSVKMKFLPAKSNKEITRGSLLLES